MATICEQLGNWSSHCPNTFPTNCTTQLQAFHTPHAPRTPHHTTLIPLNHLLHSLLSGTCKSDCWWRILLRRVFIFPPLFLFLYHFFCQCVYFFVLHIFWVSACVSWELVYLHVVGFICAYAQKGSRAAGDLPLLYLLTLANGFSLLLLLPRLLLPSAVAQGVCLIFVVCLIWLASGFVFIFSVFRSP